MTNLCYTCKHWQGDKEKMAAKIAEHPICMDRDKGWPECGDCAISYKWLDMTVHGDAIATIEVPANFGCAYWEPPQ